MRFFQPYNYFLSSFLRCLHLYLILAYPLKLQTYPLKLQTYRLELQTYRLKLQTTPSEIHPLLHGEKSWLLALWNKNKSTFILYSPHLFVTL